MGNEPGRDVQEAQMRLLKALTSKLLHILKRSNGNISLGGSGIIPEEYAPRLPHFNRYLTDPNSGLYIEDYFHEMLSFERRRTERSKAPFLLMLLNIRKLYADHQEIEIIKKIGGVLASSTREVDLKGWYQYNSIVGIIFTEINNVDSQSVHDKILHYLSHVLSPEQIAKIDVSIHRFPEAEDGWNPNETLDISLYPDLTRRNVSQQGSLLIKRVIDIVGSIAGLILFSPFFLTISILTKLTSKGPVLFRQERIGLYGRKFTFLKFRSMTVNNDPRIHQEYVKNLIHGNGGENGRNNPEQAKVYKITNDPRVTPIGRFLRKTSLDELPQFINVLKGEMSLVGPRPPIPYEMDNYDLWHRRRVLEIKPGITGLWQVKGRSSTTFDEMVRLDLRYTRERSFWLDLVILFRTPWAVFNGKGAY